VLVATVVIKMSIFESRCQPIRKDHHQCGKGEEEGDSTSVYAWENRKSYYSR